MVRARRTYPQHGQDTIAVRDRRWTCVAVAVLTTLAAGPAAPQQFVSLPPLPTTAPFDPAAALTAAGDAARSPAPSAAFAGLAEPVEVDLLFGHARSRIPIELPPGRKVTPELALSYGSRGPNGLVGRGWDLRIPCVKRSTRLGVPIDWDNSAYPYSFEEFVLVLPSGSVVLDRFLGVSGSTFLYGSSAEELMLRAAFDFASNTWIVTMKSGLRYTFGGGGQASRVGTDVGQIGYTFAWGISEVRDPSGNTITYTYHSYGISGVANTYLYPWRIDYGANAAAGYADVFHVCFAYDATGTSCLAAPAPRPDRTVSHTGGYPADLAYRVSAIKVWVDGETTESTPTRRYALTYVQDPTNGESLLDRVDLRNDQNQTLTPATFTYNASAHALDSSSTLIWFTAGSYRLVEPLRDANLSLETKSDLIDMTGDGRPDRVECVGGDWYIYGNLGNGTFGQREVWSAPDYSCGFHTPFGDLMDMNGDGRPDAVATVFGGAGGSRDWTVWYNTGTGFTGSYTWPGPDAPPAMACWT